MSQPQKTSQPTNPHQTEQNEAEIDNQQYYQILGVDKNASEQQIKKAYEKIIETLQPDENQQDQMKMYLVNEAYGVLSDPELKARYDKEGKFQDEDEDQTGGQDIFSMFFGGGGQQKKQGAAQGTKPKVQSTQKPLELSLQSIYKGEKITVSHTRTRNCQKCEGKGGANGVHCQQCDGKGAVIGMYQVGPGMYQQVRKKCDKCAGKGQIMQQADICTECKGEKILQKQTQIEVNVVKGIPKGCPIKIQGQGNQIPDALPGDLIFVTQEKQNENFKRVGADLYMKKNITLIEALTGFSFSLTHLDGTVYTISTQQGQVIGDEDKKIIRGLGMPFYKNPTQSGNLIIEFHVVMPKRQELSKQQRNQIIKMLPGEVNPRPKAEDYKMFEDFDIQNLNTNEEGGKKPEDQYDEDAEQHGVPCGTQ